MNKPKPYHFKISPHVLIQLGEELITSATQALLELVKNSYDAGAKRCEIKIDTESAGTIWNTKISYVGEISVFDNGNGMSEEDISEGWLHIAKSRKSIIKEILAGEGDLITTKTQEAADKALPEGRLPLGDKGLGRLATMKLGRFIQVITWNGRKEGKAYSIKLDWNACVEAESIEDAPIVVEEISQEGVKKGTKTVIYGLKDIKFWTTDDNLAKASLSKIISLFPSPGRNYSKNEDLEIF